MSRDLISSLFWLAVAIYFSVEGFISLQLGTLSQPGPGFFPFLGGVMLGILSLIQLLKSLKNRDTLSLSGLKSSKFLLATGATLAYLLLLETDRLRDDHVPVSLSPVSSRNTKAGRSAPTFALAGAVSSYALFRLWLKTQLPAGPFGF